MKSFSYLLRLTSLVAAILPIAFACSDTEVNGGPPALDGGPDAADTVLPDAGADVDATPDAPSDADAAQPTITCSIENWCHLVVPDAQRLNAVWGDGDGTVWTVSSEGQILRWDGAAWVKSYPEAGGGPALYTIWGSSPTDLWAGGDRVLLHGTGVSPATIMWSKVELPPSTKVWPSQRMVRSLWGASSTSIWAVVTDDDTDGDSQSEILQYVPPSFDDAGAAGSWSIEPMSSLSEELAFSKVWGTGPDDVWFAGRTLPDGPWSDAPIVAFHRRPTEDGTYTWIRHSTPCFSFAFPGAFSISPSKVYLLAEFSFCTGVSSNGGADFDWQSETFPSEYTVSSDGWGTGPDDVWIVGEVGRLRHWNGIEWRIARVALDDVHPLVRNLYGIWGSGPDDIWVVGDGVALHKRAP
jgi:hypothetical protein